MIDCRKSNSTTVRESTIVGLDKKMNVHNTHNQTKVSSTILTLSRMTPWDDDSRQGGKSTCVTIYGYISINLSQIIVILKANVAST